VGEYTDIKSALKILKAHEKTLIELCMAMMNADGGTIFTLDMMAMGAVNRSLAQIRGFIAMIESKNYLCAAPLIRLQLDVALRFQAAWLVEKPHAFAQDVWNGVPVRKLKDRNGNKMTDHYLLEKLTERHPWVKRVYKNTSGFIHHSEKHFYTFFGDVKSESSDRATTKVQISSCPEFSDGLYLELIRAFIAATEIFAWYLRGWTETKISKAQERPMA
jgi:hypothetical protein